MSTSISIALPLPTPVTLPVRHGSMRHIHADSVTVESRYLCDAHPNILLWGPCLKAGGTAAKRAWSVYDYRSAAAVLDLPADDRDAVETALRAWRAAWEAAQEVLP